MKGRNPFFLITGMILMLAGCSTPAPTISTSTPAALSTVHPMEVTTASQIFPNPLLDKFEEEGNSYPQATRYQLSWQVSPAESTLHGEESIQYTNTETVSLTDFYLRLFPNTSFMGGEMIVSDLTVNNIPVDAELRLENSALWFPLDPPLKPGETLSITLTYDVSIPTDNSAGYGELANMNGILSLSNTYAFVPVYDDQGWNVEVAPMIGDPVYADISFFQVDIQTDPQQQVVASGSCELLSRGHWGCAAGPVRDFIAVLSNKFEMETDQIDDITVQSSFLPGERAGGETALTTALAAVAIFNDLFGEYPFRELDVVETPNLASGIEYPGMVVLADRIYTDENVLEAVTVHEVAHQWWYNLVGNDQVDHPWLDEALAQYTTILYYEKRYGESVASELKEILLQSRYQTVRGTADDLPAGLPVRAYSERQYSPSVYARGGLYFDALRKEIGDAAFFDFLREYSSRHRYGIATPESFLDTLEDISGSRHENLYRQWITGEDTLP
ncbi:MAG: M1 family metallopeptidase [Anaerolineaceae bacterium]